MLQDNGAQQDAPNPCPVVLLRPPTQEIVPEELCDMPECTRKGPCQAHFKHCLDCGYLGGIQHSCGGCGRHTHIIHSGHPNSHIIVVGPELVQRAWCRPCYAHSQQQQKQLAQLGRQGEHCRSMCQQLQVTFPGFIVAGLCVDCDIWCR